MILVGFHKLFYVLYFENIIEFQKKKKQKTIEWEGALSWKYLINQTKFYEMGKRKFHCHLVE